jgi:hypothetical protein
VEYGAAFHADGFRRIARFEICIIRKLSIGHDVIFELFCRSSRDDHPRIGDIVWLLRGIVEFDGGMDE